MNERIFISYKREDKDVVFKIKDNIEKHVGEKCWIDLDGIESDAQFVNVIINAIDDTDVFLFMYSKKHAEITDFETDWTIREINYAQLERKRIVLLNIDGSSLSKWFKMMYGLKQQVDVNSVFAMNKLYVDLAKWLGKDAECNFIKKHEFVDLGLSVKWATCNVGAEKPEDFGNYFAWGETEPKEKYTWETYKYSKGTKYSLTKYCKKSKYGDNSFTDNKGVLDLVDDAAHVNWGGPWRMPTKAEQDELREKCKWEWFNLNGVKGYKVIGPNCNSIFLPAAGVVTEQGVCLSDSGNIWSSEVLGYSPYNVYDIGFYSDDVLKNVSHRNCGQSVRPVCP